MSDTPRTDEATYPAWCMDREKPVVDAAVAYGLERELAAVTAERDEWKETARRLAMRVNFAMNHLYACDAIAVIDKARGSTT